ncbi:MAG: hypothetical protein AAGJ31_08475, partial [Verrucomicrobiota bacterium]
GDGQPNASVAPVGGAFSMEPNGHRVVEFQPYELSTDVTLGPNATRLTVQEIRINAKTGQMAEFFYQVFHEIVPGTYAVADQSGRPNQFDGYNVPVASASEEYSLRDFKYGFGFIRFFPILRGHTDDYYLQGQGATDLTVGDYLISCTASGMMSDNGAIFSQLGDSRMTYYAGAQGKPMQYVDWGSPGVRNRRNESSVQQGRYYDEVRFWDWPDRGFACDTSALDLHQNNRALAPNAPEVVSQITGNAADVGHFGPLAPSRISNHGRYYSVAELGNIHDPIMWKTGLGHSNWQQKEEVMNLGNSATAGEGQRYGGGNTLRIGRLEHPKFDVLGKRACQFLDLFHVGIPGSNRSLRSPTVDLHTCYHLYNPVRFHQPPTGKDLDEASDDSLHFARGYPKEVYEEGGVYHRYSHEHAESPFRSVFGQLNVNSVPTLFEMETFLQGAFGEAPVNWQNRGVDGASQSSPGAFSLTGSSEEDLIRESGLNNDANVVDALGRNKKVLRDVARLLYERRPFVSPSDLAYEVAKAIGPEGALGDALPHQHNDAMAEEICARLLNASTLSSRHFRIYAKAEVVTKKRTLSDGTVIGQAGTSIAQESRVYDVFVRANRNLNPSSGDYGKIESTKLEILRVRDM